MVRVITQETFDAVVKENMEEFDMAREEAVNEAKEQFETQVRTSRTVKSSYRPTCTSVLVQGVNLHNIIMTAVAAEGGEHTVVKALNQIQALVKGDPQSLDAEEFSKTCRIVSAECKTGLAEKILATNSKGYDILLEACQVENGELKVEAMNAMTDFLDGNPDSFETEGFRVLILGKIFGLNVNQTRRRY